MPQERRYVLQVSRIVLKDAKGRLGERKMDSAMGGRVQANTMSSYSTAQKVMPKGVDARRLLKRS